MKQVKLFLCLSLLVCSFGQAYSQYWPKGTLTPYVDNQFKKEIKKTLLYSFWGVPKDSIEVEIDRICTEYGNERYTTEKILSMSTGPIPVGKEEWIKRANKFYKQCQKELAKLDKDMEKGKSVCVDDAQFGGTLYTLGKREICELNYDKASKIFKCAADSTDLFKMAWIGCEFQLNKNEAAALTAMNSFRKPDKRMSYIAYKFDMDDMYDTWKETWLKEHLTQIKRQIRSKDWNGLLEYSYGGIALVDSALCAGIEKGDYSLKRAQFKSSVATTSTANQRFYRHDRGRMECLTLHAVVP